MIRAIDLHDQEQREIKKRGPWEAVTASSHPALHNVLEMISHDSGAGAGHASYAVPAKYSGFIDDYEAVLKELTPDQSIEFAIGGEADALCEQTPALQPVNEFLNAFFEGFEP